MFIDELHSIYSLFTKYYKHLLQLYNKQVSYDSSDHYKWPVTANETISKELVNTKLLMPVLGSDHRGRVK